MRSKHTVVHHVAQENRACANRVSTVYWQEELRTSRISRMRSYVMPRLNGTKFYSGVVDDVTFPIWKNTFSCLRDTSECKISLKIFFLLFAHFAKIAITCICMAEIWHTYWGLKANTRIKFGINQINIQGGISDFEHKAKTNFCYTYRVNRFEEQAEHRCAARLNIRRVPLVVRNW